MNVGGGEGGKGAAQDFDLNLAPIIDCFTVLITFLLASATSVVIGIMDAGANAPGQGASNAKPPAISLDVELKPQHEIHVRLSGKTKSLKKIPAKTGEWDVAALRSEIEATKKKFPDTQSLVLSAGDEIVYREVVTIMEAIRPSMKNILLGGF